MSSISDEVLDYLKGVLKASERRGIKEIEIADIFRIIDELTTTAREKAKKNQKENIKLMEEGYRRQPELITGEKIDCLVQCPNCGKKIGEVIDGTISPEIVKKMFVRDDD